MIIFHEGMPRQGKSYAAVADHIVGRLQSGRKVYARLDGAEDPECRAKMAEVAGLTKEELDARYIHLTPEEVAKIWTLDLDKDALIVIDELQNYWPQGRAALSPEMTKFISEHGHHGWDFLNMGQLLKDCHRTWVNRTNRKVQFIKKDVMGKPNEYKWIMYNGKPDGNGNVKFIEISKGDSEYDSKYFGTYKSHSDGTENTDTYEDSRVVIWNNPIFKKWLPIFGVVLLAASAYLIYIFRGGMAPAPAPVKTADIKPVHVTETITTSGPGQTETTVMRELVAAKPQPEAKPKQQEPEDPDDYISKLSKDAKIRLGLVVHTAKGVRVVIEWRDGSMRVLESMQAPELETLGWHVMLSTTDRMAFLTRPGQKLIATAWPIDEFKGKVPDVELDKQGRGRSVPADLSPVAEGENFKVASGSIHRSKY